jgi:hypothetical protein
MLKYPYLAAIPTEVKMRYSRQHARPLSVGKLGMTLLRRPRIELVRYCGFADETNWHSHSFSIPTWLFLASKLCDALTIIILIWQFQFL